MSACAALVLFLVACQLPIAAARQDRRRRWSCWPGLRLASIALTRGVFHYSTDTIGAVGLSTAVVLGTALLLDRWLPDRLRGRPPGARGAGTAPGRSVDLTVPAGPVRLAQLELLQLARGGAGQRLDELDGASGALIRRGCSRQCAIRSGTRASLRCRRSAASTMTSLPAARPGMPMKTTSSTTSYDQRVLNLDGGQDSPQEMITSFFEIRDDEVVVVVDRQRIASRTAALLGLGHPPAGLFADPSRL